MRIEKFEYKRFSNHLKVPFKNSKGAFYKKESIIIKLIDEKGNSGYGEISPLDRFSPDSIEEILEFLQSEVSNSINEMIIDYNFPFHLSDEIIQFPSLVYGLEQAITQISIKRELISFPSRNVKLNSVVGIHEKKEETLNQLTGKIRCGFDTIKIKFGKENFEDELEVLKLIRSNFNGKIRLDINGNWNYEEALKNISLLQNYEVQFIEQPCEDLSDCLKLADNVSIPITIDESLNGLEEFSEVINSNIQYFIIKLTVFGGFRKTIELNKNCTQKIIISSALENSISMSYNLLLASIINKDFAHGLDTLSMLDKQVWKGFPQVENGNVNYSDEIIKSIKPDFDD